MERALIRIDLVVITKHQTYLDVYELITSEEATLHRISNSALDGLDVLLGNSTARNLIFENKTLARSGLDFDLDVSKLTTAACLLLVDLLAGRRLRDGLAIGYLRLADIRLNAKLALHAIDNDFEVKLTHTGNDGLSGFLV